MAERPGEVITKDELFGAVWPEIDGGRRRARHLHPGASQSASATMPASPAISRRCTAAATGSSARSAAGAAQPAAADRDARALPLPDRPSIAVLPFANMSDDPDQEYFADGISEDLITGLSRIRWLFVIARNSTFVYKDRAVDVKQVARELGVRYVLEGSVRRAGKRLRISAQLIDAITGGHHWAERYDRELGDIFAVQDEITRSVVRSDRASPAGRGGRSRPVAFRGRSRSLGTRGSRANACLAPDAGGLRGGDRALSKQAVETYPDYAPARSLLGFCLVFAAHMGWVDREQGLLAGRQHAVRAIALDDRDPWGHIALGYSAHDGEAHRGIDRGVSPGGQPQSEFCGGPRASRPRLGFCGAGSRGDRACGRGDQAQPAGSGDGAVPRRASRSRTITAGRYAEAVRIHDGSAAVCARAFRARNACAVRAWPRPGASMKPGLSCNGTTRAAPSYRSTGSGRAFPTRRPN